MLSVLAMGETFLRKLIPGGYFDCGSPTSLAFNLFITKPPRENVKGCFATKWPKNLENFFKS